MANRSYYQPTGQMPAIGNTVFQGAPNPITPDEYMEAQRKRDLAESSSLKLAAPSTLSTLLSQPPAYAYSIKELAYGLENDPDKIFLHVKNAIDFIPVWGSQKGAFSCMLDGKGGAFDQVALATALLTEAGYESKIVVGQIRITAAQAADWLGTDPTNYQSSRRVLDRGHVTSWYVSGSGTSALIDVMHAWLKIKIGGTWYAFDPAFKSHTKTIGIDLVEATDYDWDDIEEASGNYEESADYVKNVSATGIADALETMSSKLRDHIKLNKPDATLTDLIGGRSINQVSGTYRNSSLSYQKPGDTPLEYVYSALPNNYKTKLKFQYLQAVPSGPFEFDIEFYSQDIAGKRLTLNFDSARYAELRLEGELLQRSEDPINFSTYVAFFTVSNDANSYVKTWPQTTQVGSHHLIANAWGSAGPRMAFHHQKLLSERRAEGVSAGQETDDDVIGESLCVLWHNWNAEKSISTDLVGRINGCNVTLLHQVGLVGFFRDDEPSGPSGAPFTDLGGIHWSTSAIDLSSTKEEVTNTAVSMKGIGFEATSIDQIASAPSASVPGVSTDTLISTANNANQRIYRATSSNWLSSIRSTLVNYHPDVLAHIDWLFSQSPPPTVFIHEDGALAQGTFGGQGYFARFPNGNTIGIINGGLNGGSAALPIPLPNYNQNAQTNQPEATSLLRDDKHKVEVDHIVDTQTGDFKYHETDFTLGSQPAPWGMSFTRFHNSKDRNEYSTMGHGWRHNHMITAIEGTNGYAAFGNHSGIQSSDAVAQLALLVQLIQRDPNGHLTFVISSLLLAHSGKALTNNVVNVRDGEKTYTFTRLSDGITYVSPPGIGLTLIKVPAGSEPAYFRMQSVDGVVWKFRPDGQISTISYPHGGTVDSPGVIWTYNYGTFPAHLQSVTTNLPGTNPRLEFEYQTAGPSFLQFLKKVKGNGGVVEASFTVLEKNTISQVLGPNNVVTAYDYDSKKRMTAYYMPGGIVGTGGPATSVRNEYDEQDRVILQQLNASSTTTFHYADKSTVSVSNGRRIQTIFDDNKRPISVTEGTITTTFGYDGYGRKVLETFPEFNQVAYEYDFLHRVLQKTYYPKPGSGLDYEEEFFTYQGEKTPWITFKNRRGFIWTRSYNDAGQILEEFGPAGNTVKKVWTYGGYGFPATYTDETGVRTTYTEDYRGRLTETVSTQSGGLNLLTTWTRDTLGNATAVTNPRGHTTNFTFNGQRQLTEKTESTPFLYKTQYDYDLRGNKLEERREADAFGNWQRNKWTYSPTNKVLTATDPLGFVTTNTYNFWFDTLTSVKDAEERVTKYEYDTDLRVTKVIDANNVDADIRTYTANGKLATIKDARNNVSTYSYDGHDRKYRLTYPDSSYEQWDYDENGNVETYRTRSGATIVQTFDDYDRLLTRTPASQPQETYSYDNAGRLLSVSTPVVSGNPSTGVFSRGYDTAGRLTSETNSQSQTVSYQLDANGNVTRITYPGGYYVEKVYDQLNRLTTIKLNGSTSSAAAFEYDRLSRRTKLTYLNGVVTDYRYDLADRRTGMDVSFSGAPSSWKYGYNRVDQMTSQKFPDTTWEWRPSAGTTTYGAANNLNQIPSAGAATLTYGDGRGNLTADGTWTYTFNTENMLTGATKSGVTASFDYDAANRQIRKTVNGTQTRFVYSGDQLIAEYDASNNLLRRYVYAFGKDDPIMQLDASNNVTYLHADHLGSIIALTNSSGAIPSGNKYTYSPYGQSTSLTGTTFGFTGQRFDSDLGLYHYKARYYSPALCRFLQTDPAGYKVSYNLYPYGKNDPLNLIDRDGMEPEPVAVYSAWEQAFPLIQQQLGLLEIAVGALFTAGGSLLLGGTAVTTGAGTAAVGRAASKFTRDIGSVGDFVSSKPIMRYHERRMPELTTNVRHAQAAGHPQSMTYNGGRAAADANRAVATAPANGLRPRPAGKTVDEYPPATAREGGAGAWIGLVNSREQSIQGNIHKNFFRNRQDGDEFIIKVVRKQQ